MTQHKCVQLDHVLQMYHLRYHMGHRASSIREPPVESATSITVQQLLHAIVVVLPVIRLLIIDATMMAMMQKQYANLEVPALMHALVLMMPMMLLLKMDPKMVVVVE